MYNYKEVYKIFILLFLLTLVMPDRALEIVLIYLSLTISFKSSNPLPYTSFVVMFSRFISNFIHVLYSTLSFLCLSLAPITLFTSLFSSILIICLFYNSFFFDFCSGRFFFSSLFCLLSNNFQKTGRPWCIIKS